MDSPITLGHIQVASLDTYPSRGEPEDPRWEVTYSGRNEDGCWHVLGGLLLSDEYSVATIVLQAHIDEDSDDGPLSEEDFRKAITADDYILTTLYRRARHTALVLVGLAESDIEVPLYVEPDIASDEERVTQRQALIEQMRAENDEHEAS
ncbi:hypothetical protein [Nesterenkonia jeotgali]|uniref:Uncharacterized protein n=1 Tax=Nesterenkonia jeotgali TaxID=317018 RepID=A0A0W8ICX2_9MICC|nr:hypothetical protein [Nesterenkonia jeotgali]KUG57802.1 hypothetical protein AVL63_04570 [Nesterenkonia jeotgali]